MQIPLISSKVISYDAFEAMRERFLNKATRLFHRLENTATKYEVEKYIWELDSSELSLVCPLICLDPIHMVSKKIILALCERTDTTVLLKGNHFIIVSIPSNTADFGEKVYIYLKEI